MRKALLVMALALSVAAPAVAQDKHRVAVLDFGYGTVMTSVQAIFGSNQDVGKGISDLLINELVNDGRYRVIERSAIDKILKEQNFSQLGSGQQFDCSQDRQLARRGHHHHWRRYPIRPG